MNIALDPTRSVSVAASAGSGKTWQLVSRIVRLLLAGAAPGGILALTFTRKAAAEMRERVEARLRELAYADDAALDRALKQLDLEPDDGLRAQARGLHEKLLFAPFGLRAQTLHAFCQDLLTRFAAEADVPVGFSLLENEREVLTRATDALLERLRVQPQSREARALDELIASDATEAQIRNWLDGFAQRRSDWWAYTEAWRADGEDVVTAASNHLALELGLDPLEEKTIDSAFDDPSFIADLQAIHDLLLGFDGLGRLNAGLLTPALTADSAEVRGAEAAVLLTKAGERRSIKTKKGIAPAAFERFAELYDRLCLVLEQVRELRLRQQTWQRTRAVCTLGAALLDELASQLRSAQALTFADLEWRSYRLLCAADKAEWIRYRLDQRLEHLLLDEFQDTNPTQWSLLLPLLSEIAAGDPERQRTAFIVGDAKQSIYGFRRANPELMATAAAYVANDLRGAAMPLNASRRSAPAIIDFVNALFEGADGEAIRYTKHETWRSGDWGGIEIAPLVRALEDSSAEASTGLRYPLTTPRRNPEDLRLQTEARQIAARIEALIDAGLPILEDDQPRALTPGDVMVLARQRTHLHALERALAEAGLPFVGSSKGRLLQTVIAQDLMALLRFLDAPHRDLELGIALRSPLFSISDADLVTLAGAGELEHSWWQRLCALVADGEASPALARAAPLIEGWLIAARTLPAHDLLDRIDHEGNAAARYEAALPGDARVRANLGAFLQLVLDADEGRYPTLGRLNRQLETLAASGRDAPDEAAPPVGDGAIRVMTIHASKGLEAPAVFLVNSAPTANTRNAGWLVDWPSADPVPRHFVLVGKAEARDALSQRLVAAQIARDQREDLNLLYVAITRARQFLFVSAFESKRGDASNSWHGRCRAAVERLPAGSLPLPDAFGDSLGYCRGLFPIVAKLDVEPTAAIAEDPRLREAFADMQQIITAPSFDGDELRDADAASRGTAIHWLLQQLAATSDRGKPAEDAAALSSRLALMLAEPVSPEQFASWLQDARGVIGAPALARYYDPARFKRSWNEVSIQNFVANELRSGVIDRLVDDGETLWILDYKTAPRPQAARLAEKYRDQLAAYAAAIASIWPGRLVVAGLVLTATQSWVEVLRR